MSKNILNIFFAVCFTAFGYMLHDTVQGCAKPKNATVSYATMRRLDNIATQIDSLRDANADLSSEKETLAEWIVFYKNQKPQVITQPNSIILHDTIKSVVNLTDTIFRDKIVSIPAYSADKYLKLPYQIQLKNQHIALFGGIDTQRFHIDSIAIFNQIALRDDFKKSLMRETHTVTFLNSNPYISNITPVYSYSKPTKTKQFLQKLSWFAIGTGTGYAIRTIQKQ